MIKPIVCGMLLVAVAAQSSGRTLCPEQPNRVDITVTATVKDIAGGYAYRYRVSNSATSAQVVNRFIVSTPGASESVLSPKGWHDLPGRAADMPTVSWYGAVILQGRSAEPFALWSPYPPLSVRYYATGQVPTPTGLTEIEAEELLAACPASFGLLENVARSGIIQGPVDPDINRDGVVDSIDLGVVRASFGKRCKQPSFDVRADLNGDCVIDVRDLSFVSKYAGRRFQVP